MGHLSLGMKTERKSDESQYIVFAAGEEEYGLPVDQVVEIIKIEGLIHVPNGRADLLGLVDLRERVLPVFLLQQRLGVRREQKLAESARAIVVERKNRRVGLAVDRVLSVLTFKAEQIEASPPALRSSVNQHVTGVGKHNDQFIILLNQSFLDEAIAEE